jgi:hypothetical protein
MNFPTKLLTIGSALVLAACSTTPAKKSTIVASPADLNGVVTALNQKSVKGTTSRQIHYMKVSGDWAWADTTPLDAAGKPLAEGGPALLHRGKKGWKIQDLSKVPADPKDPLGAEDASPGFVKNVQQTFKGVPSDIFPPPSH